VTKRTMRKCEGDHYTAQKLKGFRTVLHKSCHINLYGENDFLFVYRETNNYLQTKAKILTLI